MYFLPKSKKIFLKNQKKFFIFKFFIILLIIFLFVFSNPIFAGIFDSDPKLITKLNNAFDTVKKWLLSLATPAAAVALGVGVFMKKFSFGDEERIRTAKKLIRGTLFSYGFILAIDLILAAINSLIA